MLFGLLVVLEHGLETNHSGPLHWSIILLSKLFRSECGVKDIECQRRLHFWTQIVRVLLLAAVLGTCRLLNRWYDNARESRDKVEEDVELWDIAALEEQQQEELREQLRIVGSGRPGGAVEWQWDIAALEEHQEQQRVEGSGRPDGAEE